MFIYRGSSAMPENPLSSIKIDYWYKILPVIGTVTLIIGLTMDVKGVSNILVQLVSVGIIFIGIGEWINHPLQTKVGPGFKIASYKRVNTFAGNTWDLIGICIIIYSFLMHR
jgi:hypothetical protein